MFRINRILCPTDFSAEAQAALSIAWPLARDHGAAVTLLHVRPVPVPLVGEFGTVIPTPLEPIEPLQVKLRQCVPANHKGTIDIVVGDGDAAEEILATATAQQCDMIIMGTHGRSGFGRLFMGSVAEAVVRGAPCPVLTIKPSTSRTVVPPAETDAPVVNANELVPVATAANAVDAEILRNALDAQGIRSFSEGMNQAGLTGILGIPITINVRATDFDRANKIIQSRETCCR